MRTLLAVPLLVVLAGAASAVPLAAAPQAAAPDRVEAIRDALLRLPYYGPFDFLAFAYDRGTVTLDGYAYRGALVDDATRALKKVAGVDQVVSHVEVLPASPMDDDIRWRTFDAVYGNAFLSRYAPGGGLLWGHRHPFNSGLLGPFGGFPGEQPIGSYPIHIVVANGRVRLLGMVDSEADKSAAGLAARGVSGTFGVQNDLVVERAATEATR